jgi:hypothetical protein
MPRKAEFVPVIGTGYPTGDGEPMTETGLT